VKEFDSLRKSKEVDITSISKYKQFFSRDSGKKKAGKIKITEFAKENTTVLNREFKEVQGVFDQFLNFKSYMTDSDSVEKYVDGKKKIKLIQGLDEILTDLQDSRSKMYINSKAAELFNQIIKVFKHEIAKKTGLLAKPSSTGFYEYALNRIGIELNVNEILRNINKEIATSDVYVGNLDEKGDLYCRTILKAQDGSVVGSEFSPVAKVAKRPQVQISKRINAIKEHIYTNELFEQVAKLNAVEGAEDIKTILELIMINRYFVIDDTEYSPSTGESLMILLHHELSEDKEVYILDEPEKSLGHEYINNVIVPLIKEKAKAGKKVFVATHDANIAVRTLPCNSVYRYHSQDGYATYVGNPFSNFLVNINDPTDTIDWKETSMKTLEGGRSAFGERGQIYGNS
jgi:ABC-type dipeptide/oligopeptide/nickel transport system ATPase component